MTLKENLRAKKNKEMGIKYKSYLQTYLSWLSLQNPSFSLYLSDEELVNYFLHELILPRDISNYCKNNSFEILSKTYEYINRYKDKTSMFKQSYQILPKTPANYKAEGIHYD